MKRLFLIALLLPSQLGAGTLPPPTDEQIQLWMWAAYEMGKRDAVDDLGMVRLKLSDIEEILK